MTRRSTRADRLAAEAQAGAFTCWVPGCVAYGKPQVKPPGYKPGDHYRRAHMKDGQGAPGTPVVEWEKTTGRRIGG
jgi:hypothetical protein